MINNWKNKDENVLIERAFLFGITGVVLCLVPLANSYLKFLNAPMGPLNGVGVGFQLFALSILVLMMTKKKLTDKTKDKVKKMVIVLAVSLLYFFMII
jgi:hypothetical protein